MKKEKLYIAGPMCFYEDGYPLWYSMRDRAKLEGIEVTMPNDVDLELDPKEPRRNAAKIFENCAKCMDDSTSIICNLEFFRGADVDGGSIFELGMAYAKGARCYGYTRDKRAMFWKYQGSTLKNGTVYDRKGRVLPYGELPFSPNVVGAAKVIEGSFDDCLRSYMLDIEEECKHAADPVMPVKQSETKLDTGGRPSVYLAGPERYDADLAEKYSRMKAVCAQYGLYAVVPTDEVPGVPKADTEDIYTNAYLTFLRQQQHVRDCDFILADLNDFHGWEPDSDTAFECGMAYQLGKKAFGYMEDTRRMIDRIPNYGAERDYRDPCGCNVENFDHPINLMFSAAIPIFEGVFEEALAQMMDTLKKEK